MKSCDLIERSCDVLFVCLSDCPQVQAVFDYQSQQPDELSLMRGDIVKVYRKMKDGNHGNVPHAD